MDKKQGILKIFQRVAEVLIDSRDRYAGRHHVNTTVARDLRTLYPGQELQQLHRDFRVRRLGTALAVMCLGGICSLVIAIGSMDHPSQNVAAGIVRGAYGDSHRQVQLEVQYGTQRQQLEMEIGSRIYNQEEIQQLAKEFLDSLPELILRENDSADRVVGDLYLAEAYEGYPFLVSWYSGNREYLDRTGRILRQVSQPMKVELQAIAAYEDTEWERSLEVTLLPGEGAEPGEKELLEYLVQSEHASRSEAVWMPPEQWNGQTLEYRVLKEHTAWGVLGMFTVASVAVFLLARKDLHRQYMDRQQELKACYPELLHQLTLYLGAGITIRGSLQKVYETYQSSREAGSQSSRAAFEEVGYVCRELATGVAEAQAYEDWGRRTGLPEYIQLCTLLTQNLQKGSTLLVERLREENANAQRESLRRCKRICEEAQTRLLLPLVLMLVVVMLLILIPAFSMAGV